MTDRTLADIDYCPMGSWAEQVDGAELTWEGEA